MEGKTKTARKIKPYSGKQIALPVEPESNLSSGGGKKLEVGDRCYYASPTSTGKIRQFNPSEDYVLMEFDHGKSVWVGLKQCCPLTEAHVRSPQLLEKGTMVKGEDLDGKCHAGAFKLLSNSGMAIVDIGGKNKLLIAGTLMYAESPPEPKEEKQEAPQQTVPPLVDRVKSCLTDTEGDWDWWTEDVREVVAKFLGRKIDTASDRFDLLCAVNKCLPPASRCAYTRSQQELIESKLQHPVQLAKKIGKRFNTSEGVNTAHFGAIEAIIDFYRATWKKFEVWEKKQPQVTTDTPRIDSQTTIESDEDEEENEPVTGLQVGDRVVELQDTPSERYGIVSAFKALNGIDTPVIKWIYGTGEGSESFANPSNLKRLSFSFGVGDRVRYIGSSAYNNWGKSRMIIAEVGVGSIDLRPLRYKVRFLNVADEPFGEIFLKDEDLELVSKAPQIEQPVKLPDTVETVESVTQSIEPSNPTEEKESCDRCQHQTRYECAEGVAFNCGLGHIKGVMTGGVIAESMPSSCNAFQERVEVEEAIDPTPTAPPKPETIQCDYQPAFLDADEADRLFEYSQALDWQHNNFKIYGKEMPLPRLEIMFGDEGCSYRYKNVVLSPLPWTPELRALKEKVEAATGCKYQVVIGNFYRSGADHIGWHSDDSPEMGDDPAIASISLGATRRFDVRSNETKAVQSFELAHGDLIFMPPGFQGTHKHRILKTSKPCGARINWTFRPHVNGVDDSAIAISEPPPEPAHPIASKLKAKDGREFKVVATSADRLTLNWEGEGQCISKCLTPAEVDRDFTPISPEPEKDQLLDRRRTLLARIDRIRRSGAIAPSGAWIESSPTQKKLKSGEVKLYNYWRVKCDRAIFDAGAGKFKKSIHLGTDKDPNYQDWVKRFRRRRLIAELERKCDRIERTIQNLPKGSPD